MSAIVENGMTRMSAGIATISGCTSCRAIAVALLQEGAEHQKREQREERRREPDREEAAARAPPVTAHELATATQRTGERLVLEDHDRGEELEPDQHHDERDDERDQAGQAGERRQHRGADEHARARQHGAERARERGRPAGELLDHRVGDRALRERQDEQDPRQQVDHHDVLVRVVRIGRRGSERDDRELDRHDRHGHQRHVQQETGSEEAERVPHEHADVVRVRHGSGIAHWRRSVGVAAREGRCRMRPECLAMLQVPLQVRDPHVTQHGAGRSARPA